MYLLVPEDPILSFEPTLKKFHLHNSTETVDVRVTNGWISTANPKVNSQSFSYLMEPLAFDTFGLSLKHFLFLASRTPHPPTFPVHLFTSYSSSESLLVLSFLPNC